MTTGRKLGQPVKRLLALRALRLFGASLRTVSTDYYRLEGPAIGTRHRLRILFGGRQADMDYIAKRAFDERPGTTRLGRHSVWGADRISRRCECDVLMLSTRSELRCLLQRRNDFFIPRWVTGEIDTGSPAIDAVATRRSLEGELRRIRKHKLDYEATTDATQFNDFYHSMYLPSVTRSHGDGTILMRYEEMMERHRRGECELLLIKHAGRQVAGSLIAYNNGVPHAWSNGVKDGDPQYLRLGAIGAVYLFALRHIHQQGYERLNVGRTRAFLNDGVLQYKRKWGMTLTGSTPEGFVLRIHEVSSGVRTFLRTNPFVFLDSSQLNAAVFVDNETLDNDVALKQYGIPGISLLKRYTWNDTAGETTLQSTEIAFVDPIACTTG